MTYEELYFWAKDKMEEKGSRKTEALKIVSKNTLAFFEPPEDAIQELLLTEYPVLGRIPLRDFPNLDKQRKEIEELSYWKENYKNLLTQLRTEVKHLRTLKESEDKNLNLEISKGLRGESSFYNLQKNLEWNSSFVYNKISELEKLLEGL